MNGLATKSGWVSLVGIVAWGAVLTANANEDAARVQQIFQRSCVKCHGPDRQKGGLRLDHVQAAMAGGQDGPVILPHNAKDSLLLFRLNHQDEDERMPPTGKAPALSEAEIAAVKRWIANGAPAWKDNKSTPESDLSVVLRGTAAVYSGDDGLRREQTGLLDAYGGGSEAQFSLPIGNAVTDGFLSWSEEPQTFRGRIRTHWEDFGSLTVAVQSLVRYDDVVGLGTFAQVPDRLVLASSPSRRLTRASIDFESDWDAPFELALHYHSEERRGTRLSEHWGQQGGVSSGTYVSPGIRPTLAQFSDRQHTVSARISRDFGDWQLEDRASVEWTDTSRTTRATHERSGDGGNPEESNWTQETNDLHLGMNFFRLDRQWQRLMLSAGHHFSRMSGTASVNRETTIDFGSPFTFVEAASDRIVLDRRAHAGNVNLRLQVSPEAMIYAGIQADFEALDTNALLRINNAPSVSGSSLDSQRYTGRFGGRWDLGSNVVLSSEFDAMRENYSRSERSASNGDLTLDRDSESDVRQLSIRGGLHWQATQRTSLRISGRRQQNKSDFDHREAPLAFDQQLGYSAFIEALETDTDMLKMELRWRGAQVDWAATLDWTDQVWHADSEALANVATGARTRSGAYQRQRAALLATVQPSKGISIQTSISYAAARTEVEANDLANPFAYAGDEWQGTILSQLALSDNDRLSISTSMLYADYQPQSAGGVYRDTRVFRRDVSLSYQRTLSPRLIFGAGYSFRDYAATGNERNGSFEVHVVQLSLALHVW